MDGVPQLAKDCQLDVDLESGDFERPVWFLAGNGDLEAQDERSRAFPCISCFVFFNIHLMIILRQYRIKIRQHGRSLL
jgi:hypothetical protein